MRKYQIIKRRIYGHGTAYDTFLSEEELAAHIDATIKNGEHEIVACVLIGFYSGRTTGSEKS